jgi:hypothetical protein
MSSKLMMIALLVSAIMIGGCDGGSKAEAETGTKAQTVNRQHEESEDAKQPQ